jgi:hypothetical protein
MRASNAVQHAIGQKKSGAPWRAGSPTSDESKAGGPSRGEVPAAKEGSFAFAATIEGGDE